MRYFQKRLRHQSEITWLLFCFTPIIFPPVALLCASLVVNGPLARAGNGKAATILILQSFNVIHAIFIAVLLLFRRKDHELITEQRRLIEAQKALLFQGMAQEEGGGEVNIEEAMTLATRKAMNWGKEYVIYKSPDGPFYHVDRRGITPPKGYTEIGTVHPASRNGKMQ